MFFFSRNKKRNFIRVLFLPLLFLSIIFFIEPNVAYAQTNCASSTYNFARCLISGDLTNGIANTIVYGFKLLLYAVFVVFGVFVSVAIAIFEFAVNPDYISGKNGLLNLQAVYDTWKFIRDFFNLFFIFVLLYIAFTVVFQINKNFKQALLSLVIAALLINFSFPISRFMIDATNVPMYFFVNQMMANTQKNTAGDAIGSMLSASKLQGILLPTYKEGKRKGQVNIGGVTIARLIMAIIFMFLFSITLLVLSVLFVVRLIALMILVIFSSAGFAASIIPGMQKYSQMWWENFWKYALFGPAAMLMLFIAVGFLAVISDTQGMIYKGAIGAAGKYTPSDPSFFASIIMFSIPIVLLWMTIGLGQKLAIIGGEIMSGYGKKFAGWAGKNFSGYSVLKRNIDSYSATRKKRLDEKDRGSLGRGLASRLNRTQDAIYGAIGYKKIGLPGGAAARKRVRDMHNKEIYEKVEENKKAGVGVPMLQAQLRSANKVAAAAAAISLSEQEAIKTSDDFANALKALGDNTKEAANLIKKANDGALAMNATQYEKARESDAFKKDERLNETLDKKLIKAGQGNTLVDYQMNRTDDASKRVSRDDAVKNVLENIDFVKDMAKQEPLFSDRKNEIAVTTFVNSLSKGRRIEFEKEAARESKEVSNVLSRIPTSAASASFADLAKRSPKLDSSGKLIV